MLTIIRDGAVEALPIRSADLDSTMYVGLRLAPLLERP